MPYLLKCEHLCIIVHILPIRCQCCETCSKGLYELCFDAKAEMRPGVQYGKCGKDLCIFIYN